LLLLFAAAEKTVSLEGKLLVESGKPFLESGGKRVPLASRDAKLAATLGDSRISGRPLRVIGSQRPDGVFEVNEFYVVRPDGLRRLIYFCFT